MNTPSTRATSIKNLLRMRTGLLALLYRLKLIGNLVALLFEIASSTRVKRHSTAIERQFSQIHLGQVGQRADLRLGIFHHRFDDLVGKFFIEIGRGVHGEPKTPGGISRDAFS